MDINFKNTFIEKWNQYFGNAELPIVFFYSNEKNNSLYKDLPKGRNCLISELMKVRNGVSLAYNLENITCSGGKRYLGYTDNMRPGFEYFLSCGNEEMEGERYKSTPELAKKFELSLEKLPTNDKYSIFKRWDMLEEIDEPEIVIFFSTPDVLSGLFTLANFDFDDENGVISPFAAGCGSIIYHPYRESRKENPRCVLGMFDVSARPGVQQDVLSFAIPYNRFQKIVSYMEESFLITDSWKKVFKRINK